jgi:hypothetical protein
VIKDGLRIGVECKRVDAPRLNLSMHTAFNELELAKMLVIYPGTQAYQLDKNMLAVPLSSLAEEPGTLLGLLA